MRILSLLALSFLLTPLARAADDPAHPHQRLLCKTGAESRPSSQPLKLFFQYNFPVLVEPEDPTLAYGRQTMVLTGRPLMLLFFEKSVEPAGEHGEHLEPMTCAFAHRALSASDPSRVQIVMPAGQVNWLSQGVGQRPGPKELSFDRMVVQPEGDWAFASQFEKVFSVDLDDPKTFVTTQMPKPLP